MRKDRNPLVEPYDDIIILPLAGLVRDELSFQLNQDQDQDKTKTKTKTKTKPRPEAIERRIEMAVNCRLDKVFCLLLYRNRATEPGRPARTISIYGAINEPGEYPLVTGGSSTLDLLALAGGVKDGAFLGSVEVRRRFVSDNDVRNIIESVNLSDSGIQSHASDELRINYLPGWREKRSLG